MRLQVLLTLAGTLFSVLAFGGNAQLANPSSVDTLAFLESPEKFLQPTSSGRLDSAKFGMTRNAGTRFHEGIDIRSIKKMKSGAPRDLIFAAMPGEIVHINRAASASTYGRYVVMRHKNSGIELYTLYAHMLALSPKIFVGETVPAGTLLGMMGQTSSSYKISKTEAHLHFEIGMQLGNSGFNSWFSRAYGPGNAHGLWNGFNLAGADPIQFLKFQNSTGTLDFQRWLKTLPRDFTASVPAESFPDILKRSPALLAQKNTGAPRGWEIDFTWFGMPLEFRPLESVPVEIKILNANPAATPAATKRGILEKRGNGFAPGKSLQNYLEIIF